MEIDVYDFDGTIYDGDSTVDFLLFCLRRRPALLFSLAGTAPDTLRLALGRSDLTRFKSAIFGALARKIDLTAEAERFWAHPDTQRKLGAWFRQTPRDLPLVVASASPEFELAHAVPLLGDVTLIGTRCDARTGALVGKNCKGEEKIRRIAERMGEFTVRAMYTDSAKADAPLLAIAREKYLVTHGRVRLIEG